MICYWVAYLTIVRREIRRFLRIWPQTLLPPAITTSLYFLIFGKLIGSRIGAMDGVSYMDYIVPGIILMSVISNAYANVVSSFYSTKFQRHIEELLVAPVPNWIILTGYVTGGVARGSLTGLVVAAVSRFFSDVTVVHPEVAIVVFLMTAILFSLAGMINAIFANSFDDISIIPNFILTPLIYLGGIFYSVNLLSDFWRDISLANPILYMVNAFRFGLIGISDIDVLTALEMISGCIVVLAGFALWLLSRGVGIKS